MTDDRWSGGDDAGRPTLAEMRERHAARITQCRSCRADIVWFKTKNGKNMPVNAESVKPSDQKFIYGTHVVHWSTCPNADKHRKRRSGETSRARR